jgi:histidyl-tRNA synthetase
MEVKIPRGFRDFIPSDMILRKEVFRRIERVFQRYGFSPIDTPIIEFFDIMKGKYGEEAEKKLMWRFKDPLSDKEYALRYDLTVPLARFVSMHFSEIQFPFKRYHIAPVWRHEEPQRGRYREFYQCDADIIGSSTPESDAEILNLAIDIMKEFSFTGFKIRINDRRILREIFEKKLDLGDKLFIVYREIDKLDKIGEEGVKSSLRNARISEEKINKIMDLLKIRGNFNELDKILLGINNVNLSEPIKYINSILDLINDKEKIEFDLSLVRGLDYYTGSIFEIFLEKPKIGSLGGGGRYDGLIGKFSRRDFPAVGISIGVERLIDAGLELGIFKKDLNSYIDVYVIVLDNEDRQRLFKYAYEIANRLRKEGVNTDIDVAGLSEEAQRKLASKLSAKILIFVGKKELENRRITLYERNTKTRKEIELTDLIRETKSMLNR